MNLKMQPLSEKGISSLGNGLWEENLFEQLQALVIAVRDGDDEAVGKVDLSFTVEQPKDGPVAIEIGGVPRELFTIVAKIKISEPGHVVSEGRIKHEYTHSARADMYWDDIHQTLKSVKAEVQKDLFDFGTDHEQQHPAH